MIKDFSLKFVDIMVGIVLGTGFQWWLELREPWQYIAFVFVYLDIVDYWIEYSPTLKKWPPKKEIDVMLDIAIMFSLFLYIYATQASIIYLLGTCILLRVLDFFWLFSSKLEFNPAGMDRIYVDTWLKLNIYIATASGAILLLAHYSSISALNILFIYFASRLIFRVMASVRYKKIHYT